MLAARRTCFAALILTLFLNVSSAIAQVVVATVPVGVGPDAVAVNTTTNKAYVVNLLCDTLSCSNPGSVSVIDGATNTTTATVPVGVTPAAVVVNPVTNKIYVSNECGSDNNCQSLGTITVIDGATLATQTVTVGYVPARMAVNPVTNKIYVVNMCTSPGIQECQNDAPGTITVIDGATLQTTNVTVGYAPADVAVNTVTNTIYATSLSGTDGQNGSVTVINGNNLSTQTVNTDYFTLSVAVNQTSNQIYATNICGGDPSCQSGSVSVIDGSTLTTQSVPMLFAPYFLAVNPVTNKIYVTNNCTNLSCNTPTAVTVLDGNTLSTTQIPVCNTGDQAADIEVNTVTNKIYYPCDRNGGTLTVIDGATNTTTQVAVGDEPVAAGINATTNTIYVPNANDATTSVVGGATTLQMVAITPCRLVDTRTGSPIQGGTSATFNLPQLAQSQGCPDISTAISYSLNVTLIPKNGNPVRYLTLWPTGELQPNVSLMNSYDGRVKANAAILSGGVGKAVNVFVTDTADVAIDIDAYFAPTNSSTLAFYPLIPCRVADTRNSDYPQGLGAPFLSGGAQRDFPILNSTCIPHNVTPVAYSFNLTAIAYPGQGSRLGYLEIWPTGSQPANPVSTLNNPTGTNVANAAIVPAGTGGEVTVFVSNDSNLAIDINGYFAPAGSGGLSLYPSATCRVLDTRSLSGGLPFSGQLAPPVDVVDSSCGVPANAQAYVFNATVLPSPTLNFLTLWPEGDQQPGVSTLNAVDGFAASNMAVVPNLDGQIDAYAMGTTQLILDISSYFAP